MARSLRITEGFPGQRRVTVPQDVLAYCRRMPVVQDLHVVSMGSYPAAAHHYIQRRTGVAAAILIHCTRGRGWCRLGKRQWPVEEGMAVLMPPGRPHTYGADEQTPWTINWVHFAGNRMSAYLDALGVGGRQSLLNLDQSTVLVQAFEELQGVLQLGYTQSALLALSTQLGRLLGLLKLHQRAFHQKGRLAEDKIRRSMDFMREHLEETLTLESLAAKVHISVPHYCSLFKRQTNTSPIMFFIRLRVQRACELLGGSDLPVGTIARAVGYNDAFYFCRVFKKTIGLPPSEYRRAVRS
jgi:AraC family transcriptional regulator, arabinose operon regulatory protein